jgi:molybdenum cofactor guanylyltransferase
MGECLGLVLAGGGTERDVSRAHLVLGGETLLSRIQRRLRHQVDAVAVSTNGDSCALGTACPVLEDEARGGTLPGVLAGLDHAAATGFARVLTVPMTMPFFPGDLARRLAAAGPGLTVAATRCEGGLDWHWTCGLWPVAAREALRAAIVAGEHEACILAQRMGAVPVIFPSASAFDGIDTPEDLSEAHATAWRSNGDPRHRRHGGLVGRQRHRAPARARTRSGRRWRGTAARRRPSTCATGSVAVAGSRIFSRRTAAGRRVLAGFDFPFGYPAGFAGAADGPGRSAGRLGLDGGASRGRAAQATTASTSPGGSTRCSRAPGPSGSTRARATSAPAAQGARERDGHGMAERRRSRCGRRAASPAGRWAGRAPWARR